MRCILGNRVVFEDELMVQDADYARSFVGIWGVNVKSVNHGAFCGGYRLGIGVRGGL